MKEFIQKYNKIFFLIYIVIFYQILGIIIFGLNFEIKRFIVLITGAVLTYLIGYILHNRKK